MSRHALLNAMDPINPYLLITGWQPAPKMNAPNRATLANSLPLVRTYCRFHGVTDAAVTDLLRLIL
jgi:hypothetical protein